MSFVSFVCEFLGRFLWLGRIRHSGHLGIKLWINTTIPQVWGHCSFFFFFAVTAVRLCRDICVIRSNFSLHETKVVLWHENDWKVRFPEYESDTSKYTVYGKRSFLSKKSDTLRSYRVYISPTM